MSRIFKLLVVTALLVRFVESLPYGAVGCGTGEDAVVTNFNIGNYTQVGGGPIADYNVTIAVDNQFLDPRIPFNFEQHKDHKLTLTAQGDPFSGFMIRLDGSFTVDAILPTKIIDPLTNEANYGGAKELFICKEAYFVAGVSHDSPEKKSLVDLNLKMDGVASNLILDVSVVAETSVGQNFSEWYFSSFTLNAVEGAIEMNPPTESPTIWSTDSPTQIPEQFGTTTQSGATTLFSIFWSTTTIGASLLLGPW
ncbi:MAG: hypothetical protein SGBAC_011703 [Bacillariaceae sp.]